MVVTILRLKRKAEEPAEENLLVRGFVNDKRKSTTLSAGISRLDVGKSEPHPQCFTRVKTINASGTFATDSGARKGTGSQFHEEDYRVQASKEDDQQQPSPFQTAVASTAGPEVLEEVRTYDVMRPTTESSGSQVQWTAMRASSDEAQGIKDGPPGQYVFDLYALREDEGTDDMPSWDSLSDALPGEFPEVQMLYDSSDFWDETDDEVHDDDSEDSNAEMHYTHDYPDDDPEEEDSQSRDEESSESDSDDDYEGHSMPALAA